MHFDLQINLPIARPGGGPAARVADLFELADAPAERAIVEPVRLSADAGELVYLTGPSGGGKSVLLAELARQWRSAGGAVVAGELSRAIPRRLARRPVVELVGLPLEQALRLLALAGLAEPALWVQSAGSLSAGQADRLALARLFGRVQRAGRPRLLLIDEFASRLDRLTAAVLASNLRRWLDRDGQTTVVAATAHDDLADALRPDRVWIKDIDGGVREAVGALENRR